MNNQNTTEKPYEGVVTMSLRDAGLRFYASPDGSDARWMHPFLKDEHHPDWVDLTDMTDEEVVAFHEGVRGDDEQLSLI